MNRCSCLNAKKGPTKDYNAFKDFHESETSAHILAAWMQFSGIHKIEGLKKVICQHLSSPMLPKIALPLISIFSLMATTIGIDSLLKKSVVIVKLV